MSVPATAPPVQPASTFAQGNRRTAASLDLHAQRAVFPRPIPKHRKVATDQKVVRTLVACRLGAVWLAHVILVVGTLDRHHWHSACMQFFHDMRNVGRFGLVLVTAVALLAQQGRRSTMNNVFGVSCGSCEETSLPKQTFKDTCGRPHGASTGERHGQRECAAVGGHVKQSTKHQGHVQRTAIHVRWPPCR